MTQIDDKTRKAVANELRRALPMYEDQWGMYATHFKDAIELVELGFDEWSRRFEDEVYA